MRPYLLIILAGLFTLFAHAPAWAGAAKQSQPLRPSVMVHATASVSDTYFTLGEIADIKGGNSDLDKQLAAAPMGRAPLPGEPRPLTTGDIALKLRQAGIDPSTIALDGASSVLVTSQGSGAESVQGPLSLAGSAALPTQAKTVAVHAGDLVNLVYVDGIVTITARAYAMQNGAVGDLITLRRDGAAHTLQGVILDSQNVQLEE